ncbi:MAG: iron-sulfur cluster assembly scaffold protein [Spirochaetota bacterium]
MSEDTVMPTRTVPINFGPLKGHDGNARLTGPCGDTMEFWLMVQNDCIVFASYTTDGCAHSMACGYAAAAMATGQPLREVERIMQEDVLAVAGDIPEESAHCALLAVKTLNSALADYRTRISA